ncbi:MAG TPA: putative quinol monooxygenase [Beijerinckiaceae bacterium]|nr:putative quinol monooxygenase [Beijerinckiaceae bacterium]
MYVVVVEFEIDPSSWDAFRPLMLENARRSMADEPGCRLFDVCTEPERPHLIYLYEIYDDRAAFEAHTRTPHFRRFDEATRPMVRAKRVRFMERIGP